MIGNLWVEPAQNDLPVGSPLANLPPGKGTTHQAGYKYAYNDGDGSTYYDAQYPIQVTGLDHYFHNQDFSILPVQFSIMFDDYPLLNGRGYPDTSMALLNGTKGSYRLMTGPRVSFSRMASFAPVPIDEIVIERTSSR